MTMPCRALHIAQFAYCDAKKEEVRPHPWEMSSSSKELAGSWPGLISTVSHDARAYLQ